MIYFIYKFENLFNTRHRGFIIIKKKLTSLLCFQNFQLSFVNNSIYSHYFPFVYIYIYTYKIIMICIYVLKRNHKILFSYLKNKTRAKISFYCFLYSSDL